MIPKQLYKYFGALDVKATAKTLEEADNSVDELFSNVLKEKTSDVNNRIVDDDYENEMQLEKTKAYVYRIMKNISVDSLERGNIFENQPKSVKLLKKNILGDGDL